MAPEIRVGLGYDAHQLMIDRPLVLGGIIIPHNRGLQGHSDADVLVHAIADSLLGAAGLADIGAHFPDTDPDNKDMKSTRLLADVLRMVVQEGFRVGNVDAVVIAEKPKLAPHIPAMKSKLARILLISDKALSIKATTNERMGFVGREEGIAAIATSLIYVDHGTISQPDK